MLSLCICIGSGIGIGIGICIGICFGSGISAASDRAVARTGIVTSWVRQPAMVAMRRSRGAKADHLACQASRKACNG